MMDRGEASLALFSVTDARTAYQGIQPMYRQPNRNLRLVSVGFENRVAGMVTVKSALIHKEQLRGKRIASAFPAHQSCLEIANALLANYQMDWKDFQEVPVPSAIPAVNALGDGRVEFNPCGAFGLPVNREVSARTPLRFISIDSSVDAMKRAYDIFPGVRAVLAKANSAEGVVEDTQVFGFDFYFVTNAMLPDDAVYAVVKTVWESLPELRQTHPAFNLWTQERMAAADVMLPYHPGAIRFFKEMGVWTETVEQSNSRWLDRSSR
jgi:TRAP transporter TAXI family solute receptor